MLNQLRVEMACWLMIIQEDFSYKDNLKKFKIVELIFNNLKCQPFLVLMNYIENSKD